MSGRMPPSLWQAITSSTMLLMRTDQPHASIWVCWMPKNMKATAIGACQLAAVAPAHQGGDPVADKGLDQVSEGSSHHDAHSHVHDLQME